MEFRSFEEKLAGLEALLFIHGEPLQIQKIDSIFDLGMDNIFNEEFKKQKSETI